MSAPVYVFWVDREKEAKQMKTSIFRGSRKRRVGTALACGMALAASACSSSGGAGSAPGGSGGQSYKVAVVADMSGLGAPVYGPFWIAIKAYFAQVNKNGGINGHQVTLSGPFDGQTTPTGAETAVRQALATNPQALIGGMAYLGSAADLLQSAQIPTIAVQVPYTAWEIGAAIKPWYYQPVGDFSSPIVNGIKAVLDGQVAGKRVDIIATNLAPEEALFGAVANGVKSSGEPIGRQLYTDPTQLSFSSQAAQIAGDHPSVVVAGMVGTQVKQLVQDLTVAGYTGPVVAWQVSSDPGSMELIGATNYYAERAELMPTPDNVMNMAARAIGESVSSQEDLSQGWIIAAITATGLSGCSTPAKCTPAKIEQTLNTKPVKAPGVLFGPIQFSASDHVGDWTAGLYHFDPKMKQITLVGAPYPSPGASVLKYYNLPG